jgi:hypothetical protein
MVAIAKPHHNKPCRVCSLLPHQIASVNGRLRKGYSTRRISQDIKGISRSDVAMHFARCYARFNDTEEE